MKELRKLILGCLFVATATGQVFAQALVTPHSQRYVACNNNAQVLLRVDRASSVTRVDWFAAASGNATALRTNSDTFTSVGRTIVYVLPYVNGSSAGQTRIPIYIDIGGSDIICGATTATGCASGTLLFREDFGGNNQSDPAIKTTGIPQIDANYRLSTETIMNSNNNPSLFNTPVYSIRKESLPHSNRNCSGKGSPNNSNWFIFDDHTYPGDINRGYLLQVNAAAGRIQFYSTMIRDLCPGTNLFFSVWLANICCLNQDDPSMTFVLENLSTGNTVVEYYTSFITEASNQTNARWLLYGFQFTVPTGADSLRLRVLNNARVTGGNDFVMDDIEIRLCAPPVSKSFPASDVNDCENNSVLFRGNYQDDGTLGNPQEYAWLHSITNSDNPADWSVVPNSNTIAPSNTNIDYNITINSSTVGWYRLAVASQGDISHHNCRAVSPAVQVSMIPAPLPTVPNPNPTVWQGTSPQNLQQATGNTTADANFTLQWYDKTGTLNNTLGNTIISTSVLRTDTFYVSQKSTTSPYCESGKVQIILNVFKCLDLSSTTQSSDSCTMLQWQWGGGTTPVNTYGIDLYQWISNTWQNVSANPNNLFTDSTAKVCTARDIASPDTATAVRQTGDCSKINLLSRDNGNAYRFYVKATNLSNSGDTCSSNVLDVTAKSGLKGFYVSEDNSLNGVPNISTAAFVAAVDNQQVIYSVSDLAKYIHIQAVDSAGNLSSVVTLQPLPVASVSVVAKDTNTCAGKPVTFTATPTNGGTPTYQWEVNGTPIPNATASIYQTSQLSNGDVVTCVMTAHWGGCTVATPAVSSVNMVVSPLRAPSISIRKR